MLPSGGSAISISGRGQHNLCVLVTHDSYNSPWFLVVPFPYLNPHEHSVAAPHVHVCEDVASSLDLEERAWLHAPDYK